MIYLVMLFVLCAKPGSQEACWMDKKVSAIIYLVRMMPPRFLDRK